MYLPIRSRADLPPPLLLVHWCFRKAFLCLNHLPFFPILLCWLNCTGEEQIINICLYIIFSNDLFNCLGSRDATSDGTGLNDAVANATVAISNDAVASIVVAIPNDAVPMRAPSPTFPIQSLTASSPTTPTYTTTPYHAVADSNSDRYVRRRSP